MSAETMFRDRLADAVFVVLVDPLVAAGAPVDQLPVVEEGLVTEEQYHGVERAAVAMYAQLRERVVVKLRAQFAVRESRMAFPVRHDPATGRYLPLEGAGGAPTSADDVDFVAPYTEWAEKLPQDQREAIRDYTTEPDDVNNALRGTGTKTTAAQRRAELIDAALASAPPLTKDIEVYRWTDYLVEDMTKGAGFTDNGFTSTTVDADNEQIQESFAGGPAAAGNVRKVRITVPAGTRGAYIEDVSMAEGELEFLLGSGSRYEVVSEGRNLVDVRLTGQRAPYRAPATVAASTSERRPVSPLKYLWSEGDVAFDATVASGSEFVSNPDVLADVAFIELAAQDFLDELGDVMLDASVGARIAIGFDVPDASLARIIASHLAAIDRFGTTLRRSVADWLVKGVQAGLGVDDMVEALPTSSPLSENAARYLARTEAVASANASAFESWTAADIGGFKTWLSARDNRVRDDHVIADGQTVPIDGKFEVCNGELADYPGDPGLSPGCRANCRCTQIFVTDAGDAREIPTTRRQLQQIAKTRGLKAGGTNAQIRRRLLNNLRQSEQEAGVAPQDLTRRELLERASAAEIRGRASMTKDELIAALEIKGAFALDSQIYEIAELSQGHNLEDGWYLVLSGVEIVAGPFESHAAAEAAIVLYDLKGYSHLRAQPAEDFDAGFIDSRQSFPVRHDPASGRYLPSEGGGSGPRSRRKSRRGSQPTGESVLGEYSGPGTAYGSRGEHARALRAARKATRTAPQPTEAEVVKGLKGAQRWRAANALWMAGKGPRPPRAGGERSGSNVQRAKRTRELFAANQVKGKNYCVCAGCGKKLKATKDSPGKFEALTKERIVPSKAGGDYRLANLIPLCRKDNQASNQRTVPAFGTPRGGDPLKRARRIAAKEGIPFGADPNARFVTRVAYRVGRWLTATTRPSTSGPLTDCPSNPDSLSGPRFSAGTATSSRSASKSPRIPWSKERSRPTGSSSPDAGTSSSTGNRSTRRRWKR